MHNYTNHMSTDRYNCRGVDEETLDQLTRKLKFPLEDILRAIQEVGSDPEEVGEYIRDRYNRS